nr:unnamed protein product [Callosobruchus analis]
MPKVRGPCRNYTVKWFYDMEYGGCSRFWYGGCDGNDNRFKSKEECEEICVDKCNLPKVAGPCEGYYPQWFYDKDSKHCSQFIYGGCLGNNNRFETREECASTCVKDDSLPAEVGECANYVDRWYYDTRERACRQFYYGGCGGNDNNFQTEQACRARCTQRQPEPESPQVPSPQQPGQPFTQGYYRTLNFCHH